MDREEQIRQASIDYTFLKGTPMCVCGDAFAEMADELNRNRAFEEGAKWADEHPINVWHEASEKPRTKEWILIQYSGGDYEALSLDELGIETWSDWWCDNYKVIRWAYISDLLPKGGEQ